MKKNYTITIEEVTTCNGCIFAHGGIEENKNGLEIDVLRCRMSTVDNPNWFRENVIIDNYAFENKIHPECPLLAKIT